ncbi:hypothetical protein HDU96_003729, partial [Phlyctochytrium bullatum]
LWRRDLGPPDEEVEVRKVIVVYDDVAEDETDGKMGFAVQLMSKPLVNVLVRVLNSNQQRRTSSKQHPRNIMASGPVSGEAQVSDPAPNTLYGVVIASISKSPVPADSSKRPASTIALEAGLSKIFEFGVKSKAALGLLQIVAIFINSQYDPDLRKTIGHRATGKAYFKKHDVFYAFNGRTLTNFTSFEYIIGTIPFFMSFGNYRRLPPEQAPWANDVSYLFKAQFLEYLDEIFMSSNLSRSGLPDLSPTREFGIIKFGKVLTHIAAARSIQATLKTVAGITKAVNAIVEKAHQTEDAPAPRKRKASGSAKQNKRKTQKTSKTGPVAKEPATRAAPKTAQPTAPTVDPKPAARPATSAVNPQTLSAGKSPRKTILGDLTVEPLRIDSKAKELLKEYLENGDSNERVRRAVRKVIEELCGVVEQDYVLLIVPPTLDSESVANAVSILSGGN